jgi:CheY-like chemotaxis protein
MNDEVVILLTEDDSGHATLIKRNLKRTGIQNPILHFNDGQQILDYLNCTNQTPAWEDGTPFIMLLDIRMPKVNGFEVLKRVKNNPELQNIPIIIISTSDNPHMMERCRELGCLNYIVKPIDYSNFTRVIKQLGQYIQMMNVPKIYLPNGFGKID